MDPAPLLARDPAWRPSPAAAEEAAEAASWVAAAAAPGAPEPLRCEVRWWRAREAADRGDWDAVSALAEEGLAEPLSERESVRLALLHCISGSLVEAEHVIAQAIQVSSPEDLLDRFAAWCEREGLAEAAARFRRAPPR